MDSLDNWPIPLSVESYAVSPTNSSMCLACAFVFVLLWVLEFALRPVVGPVLARWLELPLLKDERERIKLGRCIMSLLAMAWFTYEGYNVLMAQGGLMTIISHSHVGATDGVAVGDGNVHVERIYAYQPATQRLALFHVAWELKNLLDSLIHKDGALFVAHHIGTALVALGCLLPVYHPYVCYYLGFSEASSVVLPLVALLDDSTDLGIPALGIKLPRFKFACGAAFTLLFVVFRIVIWSMAAYTYTLDGLAVIRSDACRSPLILRLYLSAMVAFTLLQYFWLIELGQRVFALLKGKVPEQEKKLS